MHGRIRSEEGTFFPWLPLVLAILFVGVLAACSSDDSAQAASVEPAPAETEAQEATELEDAEVRVVEDDLAGDVNATGTTLVIESWTSLARASWDNEILPVYLADYDNIAIEFQPTEAADYDGQLTSRLEAGTAGDIITCRPFDRSLDLYESGYLLDLSTIINTTFDSRVAAAWSTDDNAVRFCIPVSSVVHGFFYNVEIFDELGLQPPETFDDMVDLLEAVHHDGRYIPLALGTFDRWRPGEAGFFNVGPAYWGGETGRQELVAGDVSFTDARYVELFDELGRWRPYLPEAAEFVSHSDAREMFRRGEAAIYPGGSWEISELLKAPFPVGAFRPPTQTSQDQCSIVDHTDLGIGVNAATAHLDEAMEFIQWIASAEFADLYADNLPGNFPVHPDSSHLAEPLAAEFDSWRDECDASIRLTARKLERGPGASTEETIWDVSAGVLDGEMSSVEATQSLDEALTSWYEPSSP